MDTLTWIEKIKLHNLADDSIVRERESQSTLNSASTNKIDTENCVKQLWKATMPLWIIVVYKDELQTWKKNVKNMIS